MKLKTIVLASVLAAFACAASAQAPKVITNAPPSGSQADDKDLKQKADDKDARKDDDKDGNKDGNTDGDDKKHSHKKHHEHKKTA